MPYLFIDRLYLSFSHTWYCLFFFIFFLSLLPLFCTARTLSHAKGYCICCLLSFFFFFFDISVFAFFFFFF
ncbi:hypothetical protein STCU_10725 [Strigomonas culicis]|uniref:Uncharacterized protein n=1 Tax=Strigomonas culicis TaxID=28005 RepID=S9TGS5_9TRYP|nr:hypothetical protein STCU_10725 [Strigomonas culicis]|eukprot:EPY17257.1 hypothetical protein STCU_10725 [Strigomonas culicis]